MSAPSKLGKLRVGVIDVYPLYREGAVQAINRTEELEVVGEGESAEDARRLAQQCDVILLEPAVPDSLKAAKWIVETAANAKPVFLAAVEDDEHMAGALALGVHGYLLKGLSGTALVTALRAAHAGIRQITPDLVWRSVRQRPKVEQTPREQQPLTDREQEVLNHVTRGLTNEQMARLLGLSISTIKRYKARLSSRISLYNRLQAAMAAPRLKKPN